MENSAVQIVNRFLLKAVAEKSSDIHIEPTERSAIVRFRIDGLLMEAGRYEKKIHDSVIARLKVLSSLRTDVRFLPQDGRFKAEIQIGQTVDVRLSVVPTFYGEKCVLRLLTQGPKAITLGELGFSNHNEKLVKSALNIPHGMFLVAGPTGSGKTTTLYSILNQITSGSISTVTLEDPVEYSIEGVTQIPVHGKGGFTFATALRSIVRQDPDVIMVGEIRDSETAKIATHIALTGHRLFSTLHTNDALTVKPRLIDLGVEPFLVESTLRLVIGQRLVRKVCLSCMTKREIIQEEEEVFIRNFSKNNIPQFIVEANGCGKCHHTGYFGRISINEVLLFSQKHEFKPIIFDGLEKVASHLTTLAEVMSAVEFI